jgi:hypothetical protein
VQQVPSSARVRGPHRAALSGTANGLVGLRPNSGKQFPGFLRPRRVRDPIALDGGEGGGPGIWRGGPAPLRQV